MNLRGAATIGAARLARSGARLAGHSGTSLPGLFADRFDPNLTGRLARQLGPVALVVGTNGKTTTSRLLARILERVHGTAPLANRSGANMRQGISSTVVDAARLDGRLVRPGVNAVFEVDELALEGVAGAFPPTAIVALNLFRDQLDRYGEVDSIVARWRVALERAPAGCTFVSCADDPRLDALRRGASVRSITFGLEYPAAQGTDARAGEPPLDGAASVPADADPLACPTCGAAYEFEWRSIGHLGAFRCPQGHVARTPPDVAVRTLHEDDRGSVELAFRGAFGTATARLRVPGLPGAYDAAAAVAGAIALGVPGRDAVAALDGATPAFGRFEELDVDGRRVVLMLVKNAVSLSETQRIAGRMKPDSVVLALNDAAPDGQDVSWIWDADVTALEGATSITVTGSRGHDLMLRLKYAPRRDRRGWPADVDERPPEEAVVGAVERTAVGGTVCVLATYTAMLAIRAHLHVLGRASETPQ